MPVFLAGEKIASAYLAGEKIASAYLAGEKVGFAALPAVRGYVVLDSFHQIHYYTADGDYHGVTELSGLHNPTGICVDPDGLAVCDTGDDSVHFFTLAGAARTNPAGWPCDAANPAPYGIVYDGTGYAVTQIVAPRRVFLYTPDGALRTPLGWFAAGSGNVFGITFTGERYVIVSSGYLTVWDTNGDEVGTRDDYKIIGDRSNIARGIRGLTWNDDGLVAVDGITDQVTFYDNVPAPMQASSGGFSLRSTADDGTTRGATTPRGIAAIRVPLPVLD